MVFRARAAMVPACTEEAARLLRRAGAEVEGVRDSGKAVTAGAELLRASGPAAALLVGWKVAQTLVEVASGIAGSARALVDAARAVAPAITIACTRKTFPGTKAVSIRAIMAGGAVPHRLGLSETVLVFPEHRVFRPERPLSDMLAALKAACPEKKIVVEVGGQDDAVAAALAGADVVQLEKFAPGAVADAVTAIAGRAVVAAAGGITAGNAAAYAAAGAAILVTSSPYWAPPADVAVSLARRSVPVRA